MDIACGCMKLKSCRCHLDSHRPAKRYGHRESLQGARHDQRSDGEGCGRERLGGGLSDVMRSELSVRHGVGSSV